MKPAIPMVLSHSMVGGVARGGGAPGCKVRSQASGNRRGNGFLTLPAQMSGSTVISGA